MAYIHQDSGPDSLDPRHLLPPPGLSGDGIVVRFVDTSPWSLQFHVLECIPEPANRKPDRLILLVHGFPDVAYSWRKVLPRLAAQGYHAVAYDMRGFGRTFSQRPLSDESFRPINLLLDAMALTSALGYKSVSCVVGHDSGAVTATLCGISRPDIFKSVVLMSHPLKGPMSLPLGTSPSYGDAVPPTSLSGSGRTTADIHTALAELQPPRKHYQRYYCSPTANSDMSNTEGDSLRTFLRGYFHLKSADWKGNAPTRLTSYTADELAKMPGYYIMPLGRSMPETVADDMACEDTAEVQRQAERWLNEEELSYYTEEWCRTTFRGGLNWYRLVADVSLLSDFFVWSRLKLSVPTSFVSGKQDWGSFQDPGALESLETGTFVEAGKYRGTVIIENADHWVNQEQPEACVQAILNLAREVTGA